VANTLWTPDQAARSTLAALRWLTTLPRTVRQDFSGEFVAGRGQTINVRKPISAGTANTYGPTERAARTAITFNELTETWVPVVMDTQVYNAVRLPDDFATFNLESLERQVLVPQAESVVDELSAALITEMEAVATATGLEVTLDGTNALDVVTKARRVLNGRKVPFADRFLGVGSGIAEALLNLKELTSVAESGTDGALREGIIGRLRGFTVIEDPALADDFGIAYHRDAFAHVTRPSRQPEGAAKSATVAQDGFALRWIQHYNPIQLEDQSVVDTFVGAATLDATRAVSITRATV
jgi:hypothetical protein